MGPIIPRGSKIPAKIRSVFRLVAGRSSARLAIAVSSRVIVSCSKSHDRPSTFWPLLPIFRPRDDFAYVTFSVETGSSFTSSIRSCLIFSLTLGSLVSHFLSLNPPVCHPVDSFAIQIDNFTRRGSAPHEIIHVERINQFLHELGINCHKLRNMMPQGCI